MVTWGLTIDGALNVPAGLSGVVAIAAGDRYSLALKSDGTVAAWGASHHVETNIPTGLSGVVALAAGPRAQHALVITSFCSLLGSLFVTPEPPGANCRHWRAEDRCL
jgi:alpha-tubulin suppressor-like RCC1 family protein